MRTARVSSQPACVVGSRCRRRAFTLIEIMIVVSILGVVLAMSLPGINRGREKLPMYQTVKSITEVCSHARARAILSGKTTQVVFRPFERTFSVSGGAGSTEGKTRIKGPTSGTFHERVSLEMLDINLMEFKDQPLAVVNFYPNGTCDELTIVLRSEHNEWSKITLEVTTALTTVGNVQ